MYTSTIDQEGVKFESKFELNYCVPGLPRVIIYSNLVLGT